jgi:hypothetical protein
MWGLCVVLRQLVYRRLYVFLVIGPLVHLHGRLGRRKLSLHRRLIILVISLELLDTDLSLVDPLLMPGPVFLEPTPLLTRMQDHGGTKYGRLVKPSIVFVQLLPAEIDVGTKVMLGSKILRL